MTGKELGAGAVITQLWEWGVLRDDRNRPVGMCATKHAAMEALAKALIAGGCPARGQVGQVTLVRPVQAEPAYIREHPDRIAVYDGSAISWTRLP